jgi:hypothetical protein
LVKFLVRVVARKLKGTAKLFLAHQFQTEAGCMGTASVQIAGNSIHQRRRILRAYFAKFPRSVKWIGNARHLRLDDIRDNIDLASLISKGGNFVFTE